MYSITLKNPCLSLKTIIQIYVAICVRGIVSCYAVRLCLSALYVAGRESDLIYLIFFFL